MVMDCTRVPTPPPETESRHLLSLCRVTRIPTVNRGACPVSCKRRPSESCYADVLPPLRHRAPAQSRRGPGSAAALIPVMAPADRMRPVPARERYLAETHMTLAGFGDHRLGDLLARMRHDGCGERPQFAELLTGIPGASRPVRRIVLVEREG
jgi:hypothetical protein